MKSWIKWLVVPTALAVNLTVTMTTWADTAVIQVSPQFKPDPLVVRGRSGGAKKSECGSISAKPNQILQVKKSLPYLRLSVDSPGEPTLLIDGPSGRFCVLADAVSGEKPEISGYWEAGRYSLYVGDRARGEHPYKLSISQQKTSAR